MSTTPNRLIRFWNELKRRNVIRRNTVYAATAFVILELVSNIQEPLRLPLWTLPMVIVLLSIGFIASIILSWIYEFDEEGKLRKTLRQKEEPERTGGAGGVVTEKAGASPGWKIASYISFAVILGLVVLNVFSRRGRNGKGDEGDHSIAVLPFRNDSPDQEMYFLNGTMEEILDRMSRISDLRVVSRTSVEKYRNEAKTVPEISGELDVRYVLEGSGQRSGDDVRFTVQLMDGRRDTHIWSRIYYRKIDDIFALQSEIAQLVADELENAITPDKKPQEAKIFSTNETANDLYIKGLAEINKYWANMKIVEPLNGAEVLYRFALEYDSTLAMAYKELAVIYEQKYWRWSDQNEAYTDSVLQFADNALTFDHSIPEAYRLKGFALERKGLKDEAIRTLERAATLFPDNLQILTSLVRQYRETDAVKTLEYGFKALEVEEGSSSVQVYNDLWEILRRHLFTDLGRQYLDKWTAVTHDTLNYLSKSMQMEIEFGNHQEALRFGKMAYERDSTGSLFTFLIGLIHYYDQNYKEALFYFRKHIRLAEMNNYRPIWMHAIGYTFLQNGWKEEGNRYIEEAYERYQQRIEDNVLHVEWAYRDLAIIHLYRGEKEKALEYMTLFSKVEILKPYDIVRINDEPAFDILRDAPEFQQIMQNAKAVTEANREKVRVWLVEHGLL